MEAASRRFISGSKAAGRRFHSCSRPNYSETLNKPFRNICFLFLIPLLALAPLGLQAGPDGINMVSVEDARIDHVFVTAGDDALCIKARSWVNWPGDTAPNPANDNRRILTTNAVVFQSGYRGTKLGTETAAEVFEDIHYENIYIARAGMANTIYLTDSAEVRNVTYRNFYTSGGSWGATITGFSGRSPQPTARIHQVSIRNFEGANIRFSGNAITEHPISDSVVTNFIRNGVLTTNLSDLSFNAFVDVDSMQIEANPVYALDFARPVEYSRHLLPGTLWVEAEVRHDDGLPMTVEFFSNGDSIGTVSEAPYGIDWNPPEGWHNLTFTVSDALGNTDTLTTPRRVEVRSAEVFSAVRIFPTEPIIGPETEYPLQAVALNQYGEALVSQPDSWTWSADSGGTFADPENGVILTNDVEGAHTVRASATLDGVTIEGTASFTIIPELVVTEMFVASGKAYEWDILESGKRRYIDRTATFPGVGAFEGMQYLRNSNDDRSRNGTLVSFRLNLPVTVFVAVHPDFDTSLPWFAGYGFTGATLAGHQVYARFFPAGSLIRIGENRNAEGGTNFNIYHIILDHTPPPPNQPPVAALMASPLSGDPPMPVTFDGTASSDPDGEIVRYDWDFGDGTVLEDGPAEVTHVYTTIGTFTVTLTVTDDEGATDSAVAFISTTGVPSVPLAFQFNFGDVDYSGTNSPAHAEGVLPSDVTAWQTVNGNSVTQEVEVAGIPFSATAEFRRADGIETDTPVTLSQTASTANRSGGGSGIFGTALTQTWRAYSRGGRAGRSVGAFFTGIEPGEYDVYAVVHNPVLIEAARTTNVGIGVGSATSGSLAWNDPSLTGMSFAASPQTDTWELGVNYARVRVEVTPENPNIYVIQGGPAAVNDEFDFHTLTAVQIVAVSDDEPAPTDPYADWVVTNNIQGGPDDATGGVANLMRYALGGDATTPAADLLPQMQSALDAEGLVLSLAFHRIDDPQVSYAVWYSEDLLDWGTEPVWQGTGAHEGVPGPYEVSVPAFAERGFLRLEVSR